MSAPPASAFDDVTAIVAPGAASRMPATMARIVREVAALGHQVVQLGRRDKPTIEPPIQGAVDPHLNIFRRVLPPAGGGRMALDLSPIVAVFLLFILQGIVVGLINE